MARSKEEIKAQIIQAKENNSILSGANSVSQTAFWRLFVELAAYAINIFEQIFDVFKSEVNKTVAEGIVGKTDWYAKKIKSFQLGDVLNSNGDYDIINTAKQIVTRVSVTEKDVDDRYRLIVKVAKGNPPTKFTPEELSQFKQFVRNIKFAGVWVDYVSQEADEITKNITVYYKDIDEATALANVLAKEQEYLDNIDFDGQFVRSKYIAYLETAVGVVSIEVDSLSATPEGGSPASIDQFYTAASGHFKPKSAGSTVNMELYEL